MRICKRVTGELIWSQAKVYGRCDDSVTKVLPQKRVCGVVESDIGKRNGRARRC